MINGGVIISTATVMVYFVMLLLTLSAPIEARICTPKEAEAAEAVAATAKSWRQLHQFYKRYSHCDDGAIAEGFSDSVTSLLADHWQEINQLEVVLRGDSSFRKFVLQHIDQTVPLDRLYRIAENAHKRCNQAHKILCRDIEAAAIKSIHQETNQ